MCIKKGTWIKKKVFHQMGIDENLKQKLSKYVKRADYNCAQQQN